MKVVLELGTKKTVDEAAFASEVKHVGSLMLNQRKILAIWEETNQSMRVIVMSNPSLEVILLPSVVAVLVMPSLHLIFWRRWIVKMDQLKYPLWKNHSSI
jgi:hypothetical protein